MLRGFSFPNADRLVSVNFVDPASATFFGVNSQISAMDFEEFLPEQKSFELMAAYLNGSTVNMTVDGQPRRYTGAYITETFLRDPRREADRWAATSPPADNRPGAEKVAIIGYGIWQRDFGGVARHRRQDRPAQRQAGDDHRRDAAGLRLPGQRRDLDPALQRVPGAAAQRPAGEQPGGRSAC